ncbi:microcephalin [Halichoeres trimaculatus]|uniref:microcephalin n=1 Tax=Halichoeres trimaculatus TaxID=147232 RepID=UPI003D9F4B14
MTTSPVLKDVVAYVDVWSCDKTANCSKPFVQQLQEMGAQVSKTFNKQVTHVVFKNGHPATWKKAQKSDVKLVSVLWVSRCYEDGVRADEELYPALNDESNPVIKYKKHRCMQPKDSPEKTPENDRRMKRKLDKMMKNIQPKQSFVTDVSPIIIDEKNRIIYSPGLKRSDYMAQRLKDMKEKHEYLSPTASQMSEPRSPTGLKPSLGGSPTVFKLMYDQSDDDSSASAAEPGYSPDKGEGRTKVDTTDSEKPWLSPCSDVHRRIQSPNLKGPNKKDSDTPIKVKRTSLKDSDFVEEDPIGIGQRKTRRSSVRKKTGEKETPVCSSEKPQTAERSDTCKNIQKKRRQSEVKLPRLSPDKSKKGKLKAAKTCTETKTCSLSDTLNSLSSLPPPVTALGDAAGKLSKDSSSQKTPKRPRQSFSSLVQSFTASNRTKSATPSSADGDDNTFEDYFSPANFKRRSQTHVLASQPVEKDPSFPFELGSVTNKKKHRRSESISSDANNKKRRKLGEGQSGKQPSETQSQPQLDVKVSLTPSDASATEVKAVEKRRRRSTLSVTSTDPASSAEVKKKRASKSEQASTLAEANAESEQQESSADCVFTHDVKSRGNECTVAAGLKEIPPEEEDNPTKSSSVSVQKMVHRTTSMRTLVMTSMSTERQQTVDQVVKSLGGFCIIDQVCESTTHVVSGGHRRTLNILLGIARGCWILSFEWILWCLEQRQWIPEEPYELSDHFPAAQICRLQRHLSAGEHQQDLFQDQPIMFVSQHSQPPTQSLVELIQLCGGKVCKTVRQAGICIGKYSGRRPEGSRMLSEQWVLDSITHLKHLSYDDYDLERRGEER